MAAAERTGGQATGGGQVANASNTDQIAFFNVKSDGASIKGGGTLVDPATATKIKLSDVTNLTQTGGQVTIFGHADVNGVVTTYVSTSPTTPTTPSLEQVWTPSGCAPQAAISPAAR